MFDEENKTLPDLVKEQTSELSRMSERLFLATKAARIGVWDWDIPINELVWDDSMYRLYGLQKGEFGGAYDAWARTIHPEDRAHTEAEIQAALRGEREYEPEFRIVRPDGSIRYIKADSQTFRDADGKPLRMVGTNIDITERKQAEEALRASETKYRIVADNTYDWEFWTDATGQYVYISPSCRRITGFPAEAFRENPALLETIIHPDDLASYRNHLRETKAGQSVGRAEFRILDTDGQVHWIEHLCQPVFDEEGTWLGIRGNNRDVTNRKKTEGLQQLTASILGILNEPVALSDAINRILATIQKEIEFDAVGLRLQSGEDFPYFASSGFPDDFLLMENSLVVPDKEGGLCRDENGNVCLECTCGLVISGKTDPANPLFTSGGSCWTNNSLPLLDLPADQDPRLHPRNLCIHKDFFSVALVPIRANGKIIGLLQLNDHKKDRLTREMISYFEDICGSIGLSLMKKQAEEALHTLAEELEERVRERTKELEQRNHELEQMNKAFVGREMKMVELKERIRELEQQLLSPKERRS
jgi:PAS domain S-box-containing protein